MPHISLNKDLYGITSLLDYRTEAAAPICELTQVLLRGASTLSESERELIATYVSYLNDCSFCSQAHAAAACMLPGGDAKQITAMRANEEIEVSDKMKSLLSIAAKVAAGGRNVLQQDIDAAKANGATDIEIHDTVLIAALFCFYNSYVDGLATATPPDPSFYQALATRITGRGYTMPADGYHPLKYQTN